MSSRLLIRRQYIIWNKSKVKGLQTKHYLKFHISCSFFVTTWSSEFLKFLLKFQKHKFHACEELCYPQNETWWQVMRVAYGIMLNREYDDFLISISMNCRVSVDISFHVRRSNLLRLTTHNTSLKWTFHLTRNDVIESTRHQIIIPLIIFFYVNRYVSRIREKFT